MTLRTKTAKSDLQLTYNYKNNMSSHIWRLVTSILLYESKFYVC